jgi:hypothetical protein
VIKKRAEVKIIIVVDNFYSGNLFMPASLKIGRAKPHSESNEDTTLSRAVNRQIRLLFIL